ncbi:MAG: AAA family ATPase [Sulfurovum sp.]|nr:AAA family ATPase [Sulfurovum sp.]
MAKIEGFSVKNFGTLKDISLGKLWNNQKQALTPLTVVIGKNGVGKSTIFDMFGFLSDCLKYGVEESCDIKGRGGFEKIRSQGIKGAIEFQIYYKEDGKARPITYELSIDLDKNLRPYVKYERLRQRRKGQTHGRPYSFLHLQEGKGIVWKGETAGQRIEKEEVVSDLFEEYFSQKSVNSEESKETEKVELSDKRKLGIATLGSLKQNPRISAFRKFIENWYLSYFTPDAVRSLPMSGPQKHLNIHGDNLGNVVQYMQREHKTRFKRILERISEKIPGIESIDTEKTSDGRLLLRFNNKGFSDPFYSQKMSDGTLKVFAYLLLLEDPTPPPFICIEEPENGLYHKLLETLATEFREHATGRKGGSQIFLTTHQPYLVDALLPNEVWILEKAEDGFSKIRRVSEDALLVNLVEEGLPLGSLWYSDYLDKESEA